jgi:phage gpG-like protein
MKTPNIDALKKRIVTDLKVELTELFDRNFEDKGFFGTAWQDVKHPVDRGSLLNRNGFLRNSILSDVDGYGVKFSSSLEYAAIHNEGGETHPRVTPQMRGWAFAMYKKTKLKMYLAIALTKQATLTVKIPERRFIGDHERVDQAIDQVIHDALDDWLTNHFDPLLAGK